MKEHTSTGTSGQHSEVKSACVEICDSTFAVLSGQRGDIDVDAVLCLAQLTRGASH